MPVARRMLGRMDDRYPMLRRYTAAIWETLSRIEAGEPRDGDQAAMDELEEYFADLDDRTAEARAKGVIMAVAREEMERLGGERLQPALRIVRDED